MHVVIVGAGEVGWYLAQRLGAEGHDVVVIEQNEAIASAIGAELDVQVVIGSATLPSTLQAARIDRADLLAGVTQNDEVNLIASLLAKEAGVPQTVVRIQTEELRGESGAPLREAMRADVVIDPDADTADEIMELTDPVPTRCTKCRVATSSSSAAPLAKAPRSPAAPSPRSVRALSPTGASCSVH